MKNDSKDKTRLFNEFPPVPTKEWERKIRRDLRGADYRRELRWHTGEGIASFPFYRREDLRELDQPAPVARDSSQWEIRSAITGSTIEQANKSILKALHGGSDALYITSKLIAGPTDENPCGYGIPLQTASDFMQLFKDIPLDQISVHFDSGLFSPAFLSMFLLWQEQHASEFPTRNVQASFLFDPFAGRLLQGSLPSESETSNQIYHLASYCQKNIPGVRPLAIDARIYHNSGGTIVQELGFALGVASEYLSMLTDKGYSADEIAGMLHFNFATGSLYFLEIAKFRAMRLLWKNLLMAFEGDPEQSPVYIHAETSQWNKTVYDPYTNMLRTTTEGMSAALAGCDALTIRPFDETVQAPDYFSERIARNSQLIMHEEAYLGKVRDPAAGSYYIELLTHKIARKAWQLFQEVEQKGGMQKAISSEFIQSSVSSSRQEKDQAIACRKRIFVGTNQYPNPDEEQSDEPDKKKHSFRLKKSGQRWGFGQSYSIENMAAFLDRGAALGDLAPLLFSGSEKNIELLPPYRGARAFEKLRFATENRPTTPKVLNLPIGDPKIRKERSAFSNNFFGCVGYDIEDPIGFENVSEAAEVINHEQPDVVVLCSSDKEYNELVPALCNRLDKVDHRPLLVLAGYPEENIEAHRKTGVDLFIYSGCNVLETLKEVQQKMNIIKN